MPCMNYLYDAWVATQKTVTATTVTKRETFLLLQI